MTLMIGPVWIGTIYNNGCGCIIFTKLNIIFDVQIQGQTSGLYGAIMVGRPSENHIEVFHGIFCVQTVQCLSDTIR